MAATRESSQMPPKAGIRIRNIVLAFAALVVSGALAWFLLKGSPPAPEVNPGEAPPAAQAQAGPSTSPVPQTAPRSPAEPAVKLKGQLEQVLAGIREANQKKDLSQLLSYYSPNFPRLPQRAQTISKSWTIYDYPRMEFEINEVKLLDDDAAAARVTWEVEAKNITTLKSKNISKTYLVSFAREAGQWRIRAMDLEE
jgi:hypothetical protein